MDFCGPWFQPGAFFVRSRSTIAGDALAIGADAANGDNNELADHLALELTRVGIHEHRFEYVERLKFLVEVVVNLSRYFHITNSIGAIEVLGKDQDGLFSEEKLLLLLRAGSQDELDAFAPSCSREESYWEAAMEEIKKEHPEFHAHLSKFQSKMANAWLRGDMTLASAMASNTFRAAVLFRLNWAGPDTSSPAPLPCVCGFPKRNIASVTRQAMMMHQAGCSKNGGPTKRHHAVRDALATVMTEAGYSCRREVEIGQTGEGANVEPLRMDIVATPPNGEPIYVDVTIANSASRSHANRPVDATFAKADAAKRAKYEEAARSNGCKYLTFAMDVFGKLSKDSLSFLQSLTTSMKARCADKVERELITVAATFSGISKALAYGNGSCLLYSNQLLKMYGISLKGEPPCIRTPPGFRHLGSDAVDAACAPTSEPDVTAACESEDELSDGDAGELCCVPGEGFVACEEDEAVAPLRVAA